MNFVFLMDPLETVQYEKDTSFILMIGAIRKKHRTFFVPQSGITFKDGELFFDVTEATPKEDPLKPFEIGENRKLSEKEVHAVFIRTDPPFDENYLLDTWLLDHLRGRVLVVNDPRGLQTVNEKIWVARLKEFTPRTLISAKREEFLQFLKEEKDIIVKPTNGFGGKSVFRIKEGDENAKVTYETLSNNGKDYLIFQKFIFDATVGDKRIILLDGDPIGAVLRVNTTDDHRNNFMSGGKPVKTEITEREREIIAVLKPKLQELGLYFVGIDMIGEQLIEVNVTSPTCIQEINRLYETQLEDKIITFVENRVNSLRAQK